VAVVDSIVVAESVDLDPGVPRDAPVVLDVGEVIEARGVAAGVRDAGHPVTVVVHEQLLGEREQS
jgi:hypothetical protein